MMNGTATRDHRNPQPLQPHEPQPATSAAESPPPRDLLRSIATTAALVQRRRTKGVNPFSVTMNENDFGQKVAFSSFGAFMTLPLFHLIFVPLAIYQLVCSPPIPFCICAVVIICFVTML